MAGDGFELRARLGFLLSAFSVRIEDEIGRNLDALLGDAARLASRRDAIRRHLRPSGAIRRHPTP